MMNGDNQLREFGKFRLDAKKRVLWFGEEPVNLPLKEIDLLCVLTENAGQVITKDEMLDRVWKDSFVEESNLTRHIYLLRKTFREYGESEDLIQTVPRRGYRFTKEVQSVLNGQGVVIDKYSLTRTLIEEVSEDEPMRLGESARQRRWMKAAVFVAAIVFIAAVAGFAYYRSNLFSSAKSEIRSIAILPLTNIVAEPGNDHRGLAMADMLITRLGGLKRVAVRPITSVSKFSGSTLDPRDIGRELNVDSVLVGSIYQSGDIVRLTARLIDIRDGTTLWSGSFERPAQDELRLQDDISLRITDALSLQLDPQEKRLLTKRYTDNREAYEAYLRGRFFHDKRDSPMDKKAIAEYEHAIALDPNYALAYTGLADIYGMRGGAAGSDNKEAYAKAKDAVARALSIDDELAEAHTSLAWMKRGEWDWEGSEREFKRAIELNPNYYNAHTWYSLLLLTLNRKDEALVEAEKAKELAPLTPSVIANYHAVRYFRQENEHLLAIADEESKLDVTDYRRTLTYSLTYLRLGQYEKAIEILNGFKSRDGKQRNTLDANLATAYALSGQMDKAEPLIDLLRANAVKHPEGAYRLAKALAAIGRIDETIAHLERCVDLHDARLMWILVEPHFDKLRGDPRFKELLRRMNLPDTKN
ncbi:MAG: winged helix-turn-helix domain-containing protein [Pyrinomonadaceae bacterium]